jgi:hypothetical protein
MGIAIVVVAWYFLALSTSHNVGTGFTLPSAPLLVGRLHYVSRQLGRQQAIAAGAVVLVLVAFNVGAAVLPLGRVGWGDIPVKAPQRLDFCGPSPVDVLLTPPRVDRLITDAQVVSEIDGLAPGIEKIKDSSTELRQIAASSHCGLLRLTTA